MNHIELLRPGGLVISPAFSHVAVIPPAATTIHVGGQNAVDGTGALVGGEDVALQTRQVMANLGTALAAAGATMADLVSVLVLLVDGTDLGNAYGEAAAALGDNPEPPLVTAAIVSRLGGPGSSGRGLGDRRTVPMNADRAPVGKTRDGGWQIGVSATVDQPVKEIWDFLTSTEGTACGWGTGSRSYVATAWMRRSFYGWRGRCSRLAA